MDNIIKVIFNPDNGECTIDAHKSTGMHAHIEGSAEFTKQLANKLGKIIERHPGHDTKVKINTKITT